MTIKNYLNADFEALAAKWPKDQDADVLADLGRHIHFGDPIDFRDILYGQGWLHPIRFSLVELTYLAAQAL